MKILFVCPFVPWPLVDGGKIRTYHLLRSAAAHAEIHLRVIQEPEPPLEAAEALSPWCSSLAFFDRSQPGRIKRWTLPKLERWFHSDDLIAHVRRDLSREDFRLVHLDELLLARIVPKDSSVPVVQHHHKLDTVLYGSLNASDGPGRHFDLWKLRRLEAESARRYRHHLLCSREDAEILRGRYGALDLAYVPSGFDPELFRPQHPPTERERHRLVFLGSMNYGPNVDGILWFAREVWPGLIERYPELELQIVGRDPTPEVTSLASDKILVTGRVDAVRPYLERASALIVPLRIGGGTRLKIVEALALGTPVVSTPIGAEGLGLIDGREIRLGADAQAFASAVVETLDNPAAARAQGAAGRERVHKRYRWDALAEELLDYWERVALYGKPAPSR